MLRYVAAGSEEELLVDVSDRTEALASLSGTKHEVYDNTANAWEIGDGTYANAVASTSSGLTIISLIDHAGFTPGPYSLYVWFQVGGNNIRKGPFEYTVIA